MLQDGHPISHSLSPKLRLLAKALWVEGSALSLDVPEDKLEETLRGLPAKGLWGRMSRCCIKSA